MPFLLAFVALPLIEIALLIAIGGRIGVAATLAWILLAGVAGVMVLRGHGARLATLAQGGLRGAPGRVLAEGAFALLAGVLLILPGFLTDALALVLLMPPVQRALLRQLAARTRVQTARVWQQGDIVEGEYHVHQPGQPDRDGTIRLSDRRGH